MLDNINELLMDKYGIYVIKIQQMTGGVGGETYQIDSKQGKYVYKIADNNEMNHPEAEPEICNYLINQNIPVSRFIKNSDGKYITVHTDKTVGHLQQYIEGTTFDMNEAKSWFMEESPVILGKIHRSLKSYKQLPEGIGSGFFKYMTPEAAKESYKSSYARACEMQETDILSDLEFRIKVIDRVKDWTFDLSKLTFCNTHGDYTVNQIICGENMVNAVIDWTSACRHPAVWEIARSFFYAEPTCAEGEYSQSKLRDYVEGYCSESPLSQYDHDNLLKVYFYQIAVCDYYAQYLQADESQKNEYLVQAKFATKVLGNIIY